MSAYSEYTDEDLVKLIYAGNTVAFTKAYNRYWEQLLALGYYYTHSKPAAEDIVHDVFTSLWSRRKDVTILSLKAYLATANKFSVFKAFSRDRRRRQIRPNPVTNIKGGALGYFSAQTINRRTVIAP